MLFIKKLELKHDLTVTFVGDSHTYGQGANGDFDGYNPPVQAGELRLLKFRVPCFANLFRNYMNGLTGSSNTEILYDSEEILKFAMIKSNSSELSFKNGYIQINASGKTMRLQMKCGPNCASANVIVDGNIVSTIDTYDPDNSNNNYKIWHFDGFLDINHTIKIEYTGKNPSVQEEDYLHFYRLEAYSGQCCIINAGIGSCDTGKYLKDYWKHYVLDYKPDLVIIEAFTINDWRLNIPITDYIANLKHMINDIGNIGSEAILLTVSPIRNNQVNSSGINYHTYIQASRNIANEINIKIADANTRTADYINNMPNNSNSLFTDDWHVNDIGHQIYFNCIADLIAGLVKDS